MSLYHKLNKPAKANTASTSTNGTTSDATNSGNGTSQVTGIIGNALDFQSGRYTIAKESTNFGTEWSFNFWVNPQSADGNDYFLHHESSSNQPSSFYMYNSDDDPTGSGGVMVNVRDSTNTRLTLDASNNHIVFDINSLAGTWVMCTVTWNNSDKKIRLYQNGTLHAISKAWTHTSAGNMAVSGADWTMANYQTQTGSQYSARSKFDEWSFWKCTLSDAEIAELYNSGSGMKANGLSTSNSDKLMIYYNFEQGANNTITNQAGVAGTVFKIQKQRFVETFSADALDTDRWDIGYISGNVPNGMSDEINGGFFIKTTNSWDQVRLDWNNKRQFSPIASKFIASIKYTNSASASAGGAGLIFDKTSAELVANNGVGWSLSANNSYFNTGDGTNRQVNTTGVTIDNTYHIYTGELNGTNAIGTIDGVVEATNSTHIPQASSKLQPSVWHKSGDETFNINYYEAYNS